MYSLLFFFSLAARYIYLYICKSGEAGSGDLPPLKLMEIYPERRSQEPVAARS
jgi:hypothetical protein